MLRPLIVLALAACTSSQAEPPLPQLRAQGAAMQLVVDGEPFLVLGGELGNSSASSLEYMEPIWPRLKALNLNTVLAPVSWELIEPTEGKFDFAVVNGLIRDARSHDLRLVILWFGSWKNSMSTYVPAWVKRDQVRFPRARDDKGSAQEILSPFYSASADADAHAFAALMAHLREIDSVHHTVIMVQVENEIGMLPSARDHSPAADSAFNAVVPAEAWKALPNEELTAAVSWRDALGTTPAAEEAFMAWHFAQYVERVVAAGKHEYNIPMFVNAALNRPGVLPGRYPSAGPLPHLREMWDAGAPSVDFLAPDIYFPNFSEWVTRYAWPGNALFVPEHNRAGRSETPADAFFAIGQLNAIGVSPFSIESADSASIAPLASAYALLRSLAPLILKRQGRNEMFGMRPPVSYEGIVDETPRLDTLGGYVFTATAVDPWTPRDRQDIAAHGALVLRLSPDEFLFAGSGLTFTFADSAGVDAIGIESAWEGRFENGEWRAGRLLNGDQTHQGRHVRLPPGEFSLQRVRLYRYR